MDELTQTLEKLKPNSKPNVIDLVAQAGLDISDWSNYSGTNAGANPKYCYEWCFEQEGLFLFNIWYENMRIESGSIVQKLNLRIRPSDKGGPRRARAKRFDDAARRAFERGGHPRVIVLDRASPNEGSATARLLDTAPWSVVSYDYSTGDFELRRGVFRSSSVDAVDTEIAEFREGEERRRFVVHRKREAALRAAKIADHLEKSGGRLVCEVPGCEFEFESKYGNTGHGYAQVHHLKPLSEVDAEGVRNTIDDLAVVCANCHLMIHRGGKCRDLRDLVIPVTKKFV